MTGGSPRRGLVVGAAAVLLAGIVALLVPPRGRDWSPLTWEGLLATDAIGGSLPDGFRIAQLERGGDNDVLVSVAGPDGSDGARIHVIPRGCWPAVPETISFGVAYETAGAPTPQQVATRNALAARLAAQDRGLPPPDAIPLRHDGFDARVLRAAWQQGWTGLLLLLSVGTLLALPWMRSTPTLGGAFAIGVLAIAARVTGALYTGQPLCPQGPVASLDFNIRGLQALWLLLIATSPILCWRAGTVTGIGGRRLLLVVAASTLFAAAAVWPRGDEPLHANGHAWREAREALLPWGGRATGAELYLHGKATPALTWLLTATEETLTGQARPFAISRIAGAAAVGAAAALVAILLNAAGAGLAVGATLALMPLAQSYLVSGSPLAVAAWLLPWTLALLVAAATTGDRLLLAGAALAGMLASMSHTAMLALFPALLVAWWLVAIPAIRCGAAAAMAAACVGAGWLSELAITYPMLAARNAENPIGLVGAAMLGLEQGDLFLDPQWVSSALLPLAAIGVFAGALRYGVRRVAVPTIALVLVAAPFFAVTQCSSDAVRYQGTLLGLVAGLAGVGVWSVTSVQRLGAPLRTILRLALLASLVAWPTASEQPPDDPAVVEHRLVEQAVARMPPAALVVLPRSDDRRVVHEFPDFLLPPTSRVAIDGDPAIAVHGSPLYFYLGLACISFESGDGTAPADLRQECRALRDGSVSWMTTTIAPDALPRQRDGAPWTYHRLATGVPFGFFTSGDDPSAAD